MKTLGIDTSNYTTSASICENGIITENIRIVLEVAKGGVGLRQSDAVFAHIKNIPELMNRLECDISDIDAVGVSSKPRDAEGSYMPCFLVGVNAATCIASAMRKPIYGFSHQAGHIAAALYSADCLDLVSQRFIAFHVSGGTTELTLVENNTITLLGGTKDISKFLMVTALAAIGLNTSFKEVKKSGIAPMMHGFIISALVVVVAIFVEWCMGLV